MPFSRPGQGKGVQVRLREKDQRVEIGVANPGEASAEEHLSRLLERFSRIDPSLSNPRQPCVGLAIVNAIALMHGGDVYACSTEGINTTFGM